MQEKRQAKKNVLVIVGSASRHSANQVLMERFAAMSAEEFNVNIFGDLKMLPHFDPELAVDEVPDSILRLRNEIATADGVVICTPEYIFSLPSGLKNLLEWCVAATVFQNKPVGLITASAHGAEGHGQLQKIMETLMAKFSPDSTLLIQGIKGKIGRADGTMSEELNEKLLHFITAFQLLMTGSPD